MHPLEPELRDVYGVIFWQQEASEPLTQRNVTVFADGEVDRSPCGSGTSARLALLDAAGRLPRGASSAISRSSARRSPARVVGEVDLAGRPAVVTEVTGSAYRTGRVARSSSTRTTRSARGSCCGSADVAPARRSGVPYAARVETEDDPLVMYLVVRRRTTRPFAELATGGGARDAALRHRYRDDERWRDGFDDWWRHSFRKVCLRAEPREWEALRELDHERVGDVACLPPVRRSARDRVLVRMQALSDEAGAAAGARRRRCRPALTLVVATDLGMSAGKTLAQIGHAALHGRPRSRSSTLTRRRRAAPSEWAELARPAAAVVRDGGLTELAPGSETVLVLGRTSRTRMRRARS